MKDEIMDAILDDNDNEIKAVQKKELKEEISHSLDIVTRKKNKPYDDLVIEAIDKLRKRNGASLQAIKKFISSLYTISKRASKLVLKSLKKHIENGKIIKLENKFRYKLSVKTKKELAKKKKTDKKRIKKEKDKENIVLSDMEKKKSKIEIKTNKIIKSGKETSNKKKHDKQNKKEKELSTNMKTIEKSVDIKNKIKTKKSPAVPVERKRKLKTTEEDIDTIDDKDISTHIKKKK